MAAWLDQADITAATVLAFFRLTAFFVVSPFPGARTPAVARIALAAGLAWAFAPGFVRLDERWLLFAVASEAAIGLLLGFSLQLVLQAFAFGGEAAGTQMGLGTPGFANPLEANLTLFGSAYALIALGVYAAGDGPLHLCAFLSRFFEVVPPGAVPAAFEGRLATEEAGRTLLASGLSAAAPVIAAVFAAQLVLAVLARSVPTLNLFVEGPSLTVSTGVIGLIASAHTFAPLVAAGFGARLDDFSRWLPSGV